MLSFAIITYYKYMQSLSIKIIWQVAIHSHSSQSTQAQRIQDHIHVTNNLYFNMKRILLAACLLVSI